MSLSIRPYGDESDWPAVARLLSNLPQTARHLIDAPWRLASPAAREPANGRVVVDDSGQVVGLAVWQVYWAALDLYVNPGPTANETYQRLLDWAPERYRELDAERGHPLPYWVEAPADDDALLAIFDRHGYRLCDDYDYVMLARPLSAEIPEPAVPEGYTIRPLSGAAEVPAYVALHRLAFDSESMTDEWRERTLRSSWYDPRFDIVAEAPDGSLAGFCVAWFDPVRKIGQIEPLGVHPKHRRQGIGQALLFEMLQRLRQAGASQTWVETVSTWPDAVAVYESVGFSRARTVVRKGMWAAGP
ncbi:MAG TPA: GNAT family N-acetyltransferase [Thermomicrobiaceae bacterium]|nr:GNAT family N-acetyltransferase [Thermomicrobiaceae bacterium]